MTNYISASSISSFKACPMRYRLGYVVGLRPEQDTDSQRVGTHYHACHEVYAKAEGDHDAKALAVFEHLNQAYAAVPVYKTHAEWEIEKLILQTTMIAYWWYFQNDQMEVLATELPFNLPLHEPRTGMPCSMESVQRVGKIDMVVRRDGGVSALERKSTSKGLASDSDFWDKWRKDSQIGMYALAFLDLRASGKLPFEIRADERFGNTILDVWHKPTIRPCMLTQKESAEFAATGMYQGQTFIIESFPLGANEAGEIVIPPRLLVDGVEMEIELGKKGFAIRETPAMFAARLLQDYYGRPDFYFARREISRTAAELVEFRRELFSIYLAQSAFTKSGCWFSNEQQCTATFRCQFYGICYGIGADAAASSETTPPGFRRLSHITVNGNAINEE